MTARRLVAALLAVALSAAACARDATPTGWDRTDVGWASVAHPEGWPPVDAGAYLDGERWQYGVSDAALASAHLIAGAQIGGFPGFRIRDTQTIEVAGATDAERTDFTYDGGLGDQIHGVWLVAAHRDLGRSTAVQITSLRPEEDLVRQVQESLRLSTADD